jgi:chromosome segregation ATPase
MAETPKGTIVFSRPEPGFNKDDPALKQMVKDFYDPANRHRHTLDPRGERSPPLAERIQQKLAEYERNIKRKPTEEEAERITQVMEKCSGWLEGLKIDVAGKTEVPIAAFNRLAHDYAETIEWLVRDRVHYDAKYTKMVLERDDKIKELESQLTEGDSQHQERIDNLKKQVDALQQTNNRLQRDDFVTQLEIADLKKKNATLKQENEDLRKSKSTLSDSEKGDLESQLTKAKEEIDVLKNENTSLKEELEVREEKIRALTQERDNLQQKLDDLMNEEEDLKKRLQDCEDRGRRLQADLTTEKSKPGSSGSGGGNGDDGDGGPSDGMDNLARQIEELTSQIANLTLEKNNLSSSLLEAQTNATRLQQQVTEAAEECSDLTRELGKVQENYYQVVRENRDLQTQRALSLAQLPATGNATENTQLLTPPETPENRRGAGAEARARAEAEAEARSREEAAAQKRHTRIELNRLRRAAVGCDRGRHLVRAAMIPLKA